LYEKLIKSIDFARSNYLILPGKTEHEEVHPDSKNRTLLNFMRIEISARALRFRFALVSLAAAFLAMIGSVFAASGTWTNTAGGNWSTATNWSGGTIADGATFTGDFSTLDITSNITVTIDTTSRTLGILDIGDTNGSNSYTLTNSGGGVTLTFDNGGSNAQLNETSTSKGDLIDENIRLKGSLDITNASANTLSFTGSIQSSAASGTQTLSLLSGNANIIAVISNGGTGGTIAVNKSGSGVLTLSGSNTYTGGTSVSAGTLALGASVSGTPVGTGTLTLSDGATLRSSGAGGSNGRTLQNAISLSGNITLGNAVNNGTLTFDGTGLAHGVTLTGDTTLTTASAVVIADVISGGFSLTKDGGSQLTLSGANLYSGGTFINGGTIRFSNSSALGGTGNVTLGTSGGGAAELDWSGGTATISNNITVASVVTGTSFLGAATGTPNYSGTITLNGNLTLASTASGMTLSGMITGVGGLTINSNATFTLSGANTYSGGTTINAGTLIVSSSGTLGSGNVSLTAGNVTLTLSGATQIASTATLSYVNMDIINLNYSGSDTVIGLTVDGVSEGPGTYGAGAINPDGVFTGTGTITVVPEPTTVAMMALGAGLLLGVQRFRRNVS
jgi:fibronectin-binding autotransporter adhesin